MKSNSEVCAGCLFIHAVTINED